MPALTFTLSSAHARKRAIEAVAHAPPDARVTVDEPKHSRAQQARFNAMVQEFVVQARHNGRAYGSKVWRALLLHAFRLETRGESALEVVETLDADALLLVGGSTRNLSVREMAGLIEFTKAWAAQNGVELKEPE